MQERRSERWTVVLSTAAYDVIDRDLEYDRDMKHVCDTDNPETRRHTDGMTENPSWL